MIWESGENWYYTNQGIYQPTVDVIEPQYEDTDEMSKKQRKKAKKRLKRARPPFGFARVLLEENEQIEP